jgi:hypothetical protein
MGSKKIAAKCDNLPSPSAVVQTAHGTRTRGAIHGRGGAVRATTHLVPHVGRDVGTSSGLLAGVLSGRGSRVEGQVAHTTAELIRHVCSG